MANNSLSYLTGNCLAPFLDASRFPATGGYIEGRFCASLEGSGGPLCCLPCPTPAWTYSNSLATYNVVAEWLSVVGIALLAFMLLSYIALPTQQTRSHYLSVCLVVSVLMIGIAFTIPLATNPDQCYNEITPNDMYTSNSCAWSGALVVAGGLSAVMWILIRALSMNLQICWDIVPGPKFFYISQAVGWGIPAALFTVTMTLTGVSYRFGNVCHVNHTDSMADFWGPLLAFAGAAGVLQLTTFAYCLRVYLKNLFADSTQSSNSDPASTLPSYSGSVRTQTARAVWRRLQKVLWLQWRGICIVSIILVDVVFFSIVFVRLDSLQSSIRDDFGKVEPWLFCLAGHPTDRDACLSIVHEFVVDESTVCAVLFLLAMTGIQVFLFLTRPSVFSAWVQFFRGKFGSDVEFVSLDAKANVMRTQSQQGMVSYTRGHESTTFEMQSPSVVERTAILDDKVLSLSTTELSSPEAAHHYSPRQSPDPSHRTSLIGRGRIPPNYQPVAAADLGISGRSPPPLNSPGSPPTPVVRYDSISLYQRPLSALSSISALPPLASNPDAAQRRPSSSHSTTSERRYHPPTHSFSSPTAPLSRQSSLRGSVVAFAGFDPRDAYARGGLALNPPNEAAESREELVADLPSRRWL